MDVVNLHNLVCRTAEDNKYHHKDGAVEEVICRHNLELSDLINNDRPLHRQARARLLEMLKWNVGKVRVLHLVMLLLADLLVLVLQLLLLL